MDILAWVATNIDPSQKFSNPLPVHEREPFTSAASNAALEQVLVVHFLRTGQFETATAFLEEIKSPSIHPLHDSLSMLYHIIKHMNMHDLEPAIRCERCLSTNTSRVICFFRWSEQHRTSLQARNSPLEFNLHKLNYLRMLMSDGGSRKLEALSYLQRLDQSLRDHHADTVCRLLTAMLYLPQERLLKSPYGDLVDPGLHRTVRVEFMKEYCASMGLSRSLPLRTVGDIGAGGAIVRIEKGKKVMREKKSEWSQTDELPVCPSLLLGISVYKLLARSRFPYRQSNGTIPYSRVQFQRSNQQKLIPQ